MNISEETLKILKNFAGINPSILIRGGSLLSTQSIPGNILAEASIEEEFPIEFALYDLQEFLNTLKLFSVPVLDFRNAEENYLYICEEDNLDFRVQYTFANKDHIEYPKRKPKIGNIDVTFELDMPTLDSITKAANVMQLPNIILVQGKKGYINIVVSDIKNPSANKLSIPIEASTPEGVSFKLVFKMDTFKMIPANYNVSISGKDVAVFESDAIDYYIALDQNSKF